MSAERLRQAAKVLRERAEAVINSDSRPGHAVEHFVSYYKVSRQEGADPLGIDGAYIATMHPGIGLALADWLDYTADNLPVCDCHWPRQPFAVADLILGGAS